MIDFEMKVGRPSEQIEKVTKETNCEENNAADEGDDFVGIHGLLADVPQCADGDCN